MPIALAHERSEIVTLASWNHARFIPVRVASASDDFREVRMYKVTIRARGKSEPIAVGLGSNWEEASFQGYDTFIRAQGQPRSYLAYVEDEPSPGRKIVRFGGRDMASRRAAGDPPVMIDVEQVE